MPEERPATPPPIIKILFRAIFQKIEGRIYLAAWVNFMRGIIQLNDFGGPWQCEIPNFLSVKRCV